MKLDKFYCPRCGKKVFGLEDEKRVFDTDDMGIPLFAPTWDEEELWQQDPYYEVECDNRHKSMVFEESEIIVNLKIFNKIIDEKGERFLYDVILKRKKYQIRNLFNIISPEGKVIFMTTDRGEAVEEARDLNIWLKKGSKKFTVHNCMR